MVRILENTITIMKTCTKCNIIKSTAEFSIRKRKTKQSLQSWCKQCHTEYKRQYYLDNVNGYKDKIKQRNKELIIWFTKLKEKLICELCGENHIACLDFHHISPKEKLAGVSELVYTIRASKEKILREINKCKVVCKNCHSKLHYKGLSSKG